MMGDVVGSARSALDHLVWQLVLEANTVEPGRHNYFPIFETEASWLPNVENRSPSRGRGPLEGVAQSAWPKIKALQPYHAGSRDHARETWLWNRNHLWNLDKHRIIHTAIGMTVGAPPVFTVGPEGVARLGEILEYPPRGLLVDGMTIAKVRILVDPATPNAEVNVKLDLPISIAFGEPGRVLMVGNIRQTQGGVSEFLNDCESEFS